jgi:hypothetical protein
MNGTSAFMSRIAYITPSGRPPQTRIVTTSTPMPNPNSHLPAFVTGLVTMSVAMNTAPSMSPPEKSMKRGVGYFAFAAWSTLENSATVAKMLAGMRQFRYCRHAR